MRRLRVAWLPDGKRLHLRYGPVNLIIQAFGPPCEVGRAYNAGIERARAVVAELAEDLPRLQSGMAAQTAVGQRAVAACQAVPGALGPVTALPGAVADEVLLAMAQAGQLDRAFANNHGAVALHLAEGQNILPAVFDWPDYQRYEATVPILASGRTRGLAAAGWSYDPFALGCVDRLHVAAFSSALAAAAMGSIAALMRPAGAPTVPLMPGSVLEGLEVYVPVPDITADEAAALLARGYAAAEAMFAAGTVNLVMLGIGPSNFLVAAPHFSLKALLSLQG